VQNWPCQCNCDRAFFPCSWALLHRLEASYSQQVVPAIYRVLRDPKHKPCSHPQCVCVCAVLIRQVFPVVYLCAPCRRCIKCSGRKSAMGVPGALSCKTPCTRGQQTWRQHRHSLSQHGRSVLHLKLSSSAFRANCRMHSGRTWCCSST
jgi:hypothetical protein